MSQGAERIVVGNWKCTKSIDDGRRWLDEFASSYEASPLTEVVIAPSMIILAQLAAHLRELGLQRVSLAAQDISPFPPGDYTGAVAADMLRGIADYAIIGHPERRRYFHETAQDAVNKVREAVDAGVTPIICVATDDAISQLTALGDIDCDNLVIAYCPVDLMSHRQPEAPDRVVEAAAMIAQVHPARPIIYGGAVTAANVGSYAGLDRVAGLFVGEASRDPAAFATIVAAVRSR